MAAGNSAPLPSDVIDLQYPLRDFGGKQFNC